MMEIANVYKFSIFLWRRFMYSVHCIVNIFMCMCIFLPYLFLLVYFVWFYKSLHEIHINKICLGRYLRPVWADDDTK